MQDKHAGLMNEIKQLDLNETVSDCETVRHRIQEEIEQARFSSVTMTEDAAKSIWAKCETITHGLAMQLCEQLRLILEPTKMTKLKGDYRTGKRLNMKKLVPYIASQFKKDKIWMRRAKPAKREYQVLLAVDDSKSMSESNSVELAYESLALISKALSQLEIGQMGVMRFGEVAELVHPFESPFTSEFGMSVVRSFTFRQEKTNILNLLRSSTEIMSQQLQRSTSRNCNLWQLQIIISDGLCEDHETIRRLVRQAFDQRLLVVFIIIDQNHNQQSLFNTKNVSFVSGRLVMKEYMDTFPFDFYVILRNIRGLPDVLSDALRQWFEIAKE
jgi:midasin (ATPase involved in ribosome maturation)